MYIAGTNLYVYGGWDGQKAHNVLHQLDLSTFTWSVVKVENPDDAPPKMSGCGIVAYGDDKLVLFGGYGEKKKKKVKVVKKKVVISDKDTTGEHKVQMEGDKTKDVPTDKDEANHGVEHSEKAAEDGVDREQVKNGTAESAATESGTELGQNGTESEETIQSNGGVEEVKDENEGGLGGTASEPDEGTKEQSKEESIKLPKKVSFEDQEVSTQEEVSVEVHVDGETAEEGQAQEGQNGDKREDQISGEQEQMKNGTAKLGEEAESVKDDEEEEEEEEGSGRGYYLRKRRPVVYQYQPIIQVR